MRYSFKVVVSALALLALAACGDPSKGEILKKAENASTKAELEKALGAPTEVDKVGPLEKWTYQASDGVVVFAIIGDTVTMQATSDRD